MHHLEEEAKQEGLELSFSELVILSNSAKNNIVEFWRVFTDAISVRFISVELEQSAGSGDGRREDAGLSV